jgi:hypothetical protein
VELNLFRYLVADGEHRIERSLGVLKYHGYPVTAELPQSLVGTLQQVFVVIEYLSTNYSTWGTINQAQN